MINVLLSLSYNAGEFTQGKVSMGDDSNGCIALNLKEMETIK